MPSFVSDYYGFNKNCIVNLYKLHQELANEINSVFDYGTTCPVLNMINDSLVKSNHPRTNGILADILRSGILFDEPEINA